MAVCLYQRHSVSRQISPTGETPGSYDKYSNGILSIRCDEQYKALTVIRVPLTPTVNMQTMMTANGQSHVTTDVFLKKSCATKHQVMARWQCETIGVTWFQLKLKVKNRSLWSLIKYFLRLIISNSVCYPTEGWSLAELF